jgi:hypothetical protein
MPARAAAESIATRRRRFIPTRGGTGAQGVGSAGNGDLCCSAAATPSFSNKLRINNKTQFIPLVTPKNSFGSPLGQH